MKKISGFGIRMRQLREFSGLTQEQMADVIKVSAKAISRYENLKAEPTVAILEAYAEYFDVTTDFILDYRPTRYAIEHVQQLINTLQFETENDRMNKIRWALQVPELVVAEELKEYKKEV